MRRKVFFRADGNKNIGIGHVVRSLALVEILKDKFDCHFISINPSNDVKDLILNSCTNLHILNYNFIEKLEAHYLIDIYISQNDIVVLDGYHFKTNYQEILKNHGCKIICIDDIYNYHFVSDIVINHAPDTNRDRYSVSKNTELLLGLNYALLRKPFLKNLKAKNENQRNEHEVFVNFGGVDKHNLTLKIMNWLLIDDHFQTLNIVLGVENAFEKEFEMLKTQKAKHRVINIFKSINASKLVSLFKRSSLAIVPASTIAIECIATRTPMLTGYYVENQIDVYHELLNLDSSINGLGNFVTLNKSKFSKKIVEIVSGDKRNMDIIIDNDIENFYLEKLSKL